MNEIIKENEKNTFKVLKSSSQPFAQFKSNLTQSIFRWMEIKYLYPSLMVIYSDIPRIHLKLLEIFLWNQLPFLQNLSKLDSKHCVSSS